MLAQKVWNPSFVGKCKLMSIYECCLMYQSLCSSTIVMMYYVHHTGILIGLLQIPIIVTIRDTIGGSSSYCTLLSQGLGNTGLLSSKYFNYFSRFRFGMGNWWQVSCHQIISVVFMNNNKY